VCIHSASVVDPRDVMKARSNVDCRVRKSRSTQVAARRLRYARTGAALPHGAANQVGYAGSAARTVNGTGTRACSLCARWSCVAVIVVKNRAILTRPECTSRTASSCMHREKPFPDAWHPPTAGDERTNLHPARGSSAPNVVISTRHGYTSDISRRRVHTAEIIVCCSNGRA
jgi:hypothetical protein